jgi:hypothetical protein
MAGLDPAIPDQLMMLNIWMRGSSPRMTEMGAYRLVCGANHPTIKGAVDRSHPTAIRIGARSLAAEPSKGMNHATAEKTAA